MRWRLVGALFASLFVLGAACGGRSVRHDAGDAGEGAEGPQGSGGSLTGSTGAGATGGGPTGGAGGTAGTGGIHSIIEPKSCTFEGRVLAIGESVEDPETCRTCVCQRDGSVTCSQCNATCRYAGGTLGIGQSIVQPDGCTECHCKVGGLDCDSSSCAMPDPCRDLLAEYEHAVGAERWCGPQYDDYCQDALLVSASLPCYCPVPVRNVEVVVPIRDEYFAMGCGANVLCEPCNEPHAPFRCGEAGFCVGR